MAIRISDYINAVNTSVVHASANDPTTSNDDFSVGSIWVNTVTDAIWICVDAAIGNALWKQYLSFAVVSDEQTATAGQTVFNLSFTYEVGAEQLAVYVDGVRQSSDAFVETDTGTVTMTESLVAGNRLTFVTNSSELSSYNADAIKSAIGEMVSGNSEGGVDVTYSAEKLNFDVDVKSVAGRTGNITLSTTDVSEGDNEYYTTARVTSHTDVAANSTARHQHTNIVNLNNITSEGSGDIITSVERTKLATIETSATAGMLTASQVLSELITVDGTGSGLDADLLDGQEGTYYNSLTNATDTINDAKHDSLSGGSLHSASTTSVNGFMSSGDKTKLDSCDTGAKDDQTASEILTAIKTVDGTGSGLDADTVDGVEESAFTLADGTRAFTGTVDGVVPTADAHLSTKGYVDGVASGLAVHDPVRIASTVELTVVYDNGTAGVGATLTNADTQASFAVDGITGVVSDRVMIKDQTTNAEQNGIYTVTTVGDGSTNWVLTRSTDFDNSPTQEIHDGDYFFVGEGTTNEHIGFVQTEPGVITVGTTDINFTQFSGAGQITAGNGLDKSGNELSIETAITTKLSGIDTGATDDQTGTEILTAIKTVDGASSGLDADTVDGVEESAFSLADGTRAFTGTVDGVTPTSDNNLATKGYVDGFIHPIEKHEETATASQTVVNTAFTYTSGNIAVYVAGVRQMSSAYTETDTDTITFTSGLDAGDEILIVFPG